VFHVHNILLEDGRIESGQFELNPTSEEGQAVCTVFTEFLKNRPTAFREKIAFLKRGDFELDWSAAGGGVALASWAESGETLAMGVLLTLNRHHSAGIAMVTLGMAVKATAGIALPFLVWVWAGRLEGTLARRFVRAAAAGIGVTAVTFAVCMALARVNFGWIGALNAPTLIVNWVNLPTGLGELTHSIVSWFGDVPEQPFDNMFRFVAVASLLVIIVVQWWRARGGGADAARRAGVALLAVAILAPPTLPWYLTWGLVIFGATPWRRSWMAFSAGLAVLILLVYFPTGEGAMGNLWHMIWVILAAILAGVSMIKEDPLGLRSKPAFPVTLSAVSTASVTVPATPTVDGAVDAVSSEVGSWAEEGAQQR